MIWAMKKTVNVLLTTAAGAMFPVAFLFALVGAAHLFDELSFMVVPIAMALPLGIWLLYRKMGHHE